MGISLVSCLSVVKHSPAGLSTMAGGTGQDKWQKETTWSGPRRHLSPQPPRFQIPGGVLCQPTVLFRRKRTSPRDAHQHRAKKASSWIPTTLGGSGHTYTEQAREGGRTNNVPNGRDLDPELAKRSRLLGILCGDSDDKGRNLNSENAETSFAQVVMSCVTGRTSLGHSTFADSNKTHQVSPDAT